MIAFDDGKGFELIFAVKAVEEPVEVVHFKIVKVFRDIAERHNKIRLGKARQFQHIFNRRLTDIRSDLCIGNEHERAIDAGSGEGFETSGRYRGNFGSVGIKGDDLIIIHRFRKEVFQMKAMDLTGNALAGKCVPEDPALCIFFRPVPDAADDGSTELAAYCRTVTG